jgi:PAS domain S-box-containing protein
MAKKPTYKELEQRVKEMERPGITYKQARKALRESLDKQEGLVETPSEPEMAVEVLKRKEAEEQPVEQILIAEHIFRKTIEESIPSGIAGIDLEGRQIYVNRVFCDMVGWGDEELIGAKYPFVYWSPKEIESVPDNFKLLLNDKVPSEGIELPFLRKDGERFWGLVLSSTLADSEGNAIGRLMSVADISERKRVEKTMRALSSRLISAQETERKFVSQDLHDSIGGKLTGIKYSLEKIISDLKNEQYSLEPALKDTLSIVHDTIEETQRIYKNLHPSVLDDLGLLSAIRSICREFQEVYSKIQMKNHINISESEVPDLLKISIYRILQEALNNVAKHSHADTVKLSLRRIKNNIELTIEDNGKGFDLNQVLHEDSRERGLGLDSIRERVEFFDGILEIRSKKEKGTRIRAIWSCQ